MSRALVFDHDIEGLDKASVYCRVARICSAVAGVPVSQLHQVAAVSTEAPTLETKSLETRPQEGF